ncbi:NosD domain-containing protein [Candidatus Lokiarchaeum ossiferum]|uniref:NosD domain-containing protein n=1 Tax=Candidatus Lokiarchaeum ossiferum TaxID=2951803 RepID=UPI00352F98B3
MAKVNKLIFLLIILLTIPNFRLFGNSGDFERNYISTNRIPGSSSHSSINLVGNEQIEVFFSGNTSYDGMSWETAYILKDFIIDANFGTYGINIANTTHHFIIQNLTIFNAIDGIFASGIKLENCTNVKITNCSLYNNSIGINLNIFSSNLNVSQNFISNSTNTGIFTLAVYNSSISSNNISFSEAGIRFIGLFNSSIEKNLIHDNFDYGFDVLLCYTSNFTNNEVFRNNYGMKLGFGSINNTFSNNSILDNCEIGLFLEESENNTFHENLFVNNSIRIFNTSSDSILSSNLLNDKPICSFSSIYNTNITGNSYSDCGLLIINNCSNLNISKFIIENSANAIYIVDSDSINIFENSITLSHSGLFFENSENINAFHNNLSYNFDGIVGINLERTFFLENNISNNINFGIKWDLVNNSNILKNKVYRNNFDGVILSSSFFNLIENNNFEENKRNGLTLIDSELNNITYNKINQNIEDGLFLEDSPENRILNNSFLENKFSGLQLYYSNSCIIEENLFSGNDESGIYNYNSNFSKISYNVIENNEFDGIMLKGSNNRIYQNLIFSNQIGIEILFSEGNKNVIFENNFSMNDLHAKDDLNHATWYFSGVGNYWDNYNGFDYDDDMIGDSSYTLLPNIIDPFPLWDDGANHIPSIYNNNDNVAVYNFTATNSGILKWTLSDPDVRNGWYTILHNNMVFKSQEFIAWTSGIEIDIAYANLHLGFHNFTIIVSDGVGGLNESSNFIIMNDAPNLITQLEDNQIIFLDDGNITFWSLNDSIHNDRANMTISSNDVVIKEYSGIEQINFNIDPIHLGVGNFVIRVEVFDGLCPPISDEINILINDKPKIYPNVHLKELYDNSTDVIHLGNISDEFNFNANYSIYINGVINYTLEWDGELEIYFNISALKNGSYTIKILFSDGYNGTVSKDFKFKIEIYEFERYNEEDESTNDYLIYAIFGSSVFVITPITIFLVQRLKKKKKE